MNHQLDSVIISPHGLTARRYVDEVLRPHVIPMHRQIGRNFILLQDNACSHIARIARTYLKENNIEILPHPAYSLDLNNVKMALKQNDVPEEQKTILIQNNSIKNNVAKMLKTVEILNKEQNNNDNDFEEYDYTTFLLKLYEKIDFELNHIEKKYLGSQAIEIIDTREDLQKSNEVTS